MELKLWFTIVVTVWAASEIAMALFKRSRSDAPSRRDGGSLPLLIVAFAGSATLGLTLDFSPAANIYGNETSRWAAALALVIAGILFRWNAILTLGRYFTTNVAIQSDHRLVREGVYRTLRHPSYTGTLLILAGVAVATGNWINAAIVMGPSVVAILRRIRIEEQLLLESFGQDYIDFCKKTKRLVPGLY